MIPTARFDHLHGAARDAALEQADAFERAALRRLAELRAALDGHPKASVSGAPAFRRALAAVASATSERPTTNRAARRRDLSGAPGRAPGRRAP